MIYIAIGKFGWGRGPTAKEALKELRKNVAPADKNIYIVYSSHDDGAYVDHRGTIHARGMLTEIERKGWPDR